MRDKSNSTTLFGVLETKLIKGKAKSTAQVEPRKILETATNLFRRVRRVLCVRSPK